MSQLEDLQQSAKKMSREELLAKICEVRKSRRIPKITAKSLKKKMQVKKVKKPKITIESKMINMDDAELNKLEALLKARLEKK